MIILASARYWSATVSEHLVPLLSSSYLQAILWSCYSAGFVLQCNMYGRPFSMFGSTQLRVNGDV